ncbi:uncharacterized protein LOC124132086 [Haliotis rufescens]|uniref:uncharacterized protein LOC124132086 n=1 Tax=Haliotis rufescens TaxID=6454 RepID=UPI00201F315B|nr:uncharacterized protein LOC124132086 [Haliotis rufescens]
MKITAVVLVVVVGAVVVNAGVAPNQRVQQHALTGRPRGDQGELTHQNTLPSSGKGGASNVGKSTSGLHRANNGGYGNFISQPVTFDRLDDGYPDREQLTEIANFGIGFAVAQRQTKFSPVRYDHGGSSHGSFGNSNDGLIHGSHGNGGLTNGVHSNNGPVNGVHSNNGVHGNGGLVNGNIGDHVHGGSTFGGNTRGYSQTDSGLNRIGASIDKEFNSFGASDREFHRAVNPSLPTTGHVINTDNIHVGVPIASRPVHSRLKGYGDINAAISTYRLGVRNIDLGANTALDGENIRPYGQNNNFGVTGAVGQDKQGTERSHGGNDVFGNSGQTYAAADVQGLAFHTGGLRFPGAPQAGPDSFKNDQFFSGTANHVNSGNVYTQGNLGNHGNPEHVPKAKGREGNLGNGRA